jgi:hypothetical protein
MIKNRRHLMRLVRPDAALPVFAAGIMEETGWLEKSFNYDRHDFDIFYRSGHN